MDMVDAFSVGAANSLTRLQGSIVTDGLDKLNSAASSGSRNSFAAARQSMSDTYNFSTSVLSAVYEGKGAIINMNR